MVDGSLALTTDRFILRFEGIAVDPALRSEVHLMIGGKRNGGLRSSLQNVQLFSKYRDGVATVTLDAIPAFALRLREGGRLAEVDGLTIDLSGRRRTIVVHQDGSASVR